MISRIGLFLFAVALGPFSSNAKAQSKPISATTNTCYTLATQTITADNPCLGDVYFAAGANVDISSASGTENLCLLPGTFATVDNVPSDFSNCGWDSYIEGMDGLTGKGLIVSDRAGHHHYKWRVQSNTLPQIVFEQETID